MDDLGHRVERGRMAGVRPELDSGAHWVLSGPSSGYFDGCMPGAALFSGLGVAFVLPHHWRYPHPGMAHSSMCEVLRKGSFLYAAACWWGP